MYSLVHRTSLSEAIQVARIRPGRPETRRELKHAARSKNSWKLPDAHTQSGFEFGEPLLAEFPSRDMSHSCPGCY